MINQCKCFNKSNGRMIKMIPKVSIVVPVYNVEKYLEKCLDSIVSQTCQDFVVYLVNDGSPDRSIDIMRKYQKMHPDMFVVINKLNGGLSSARNKAIRQVYTKYITFIDSDDYVHDRYIELLLKTIEQHDADIVECGLKKVYTNDKQNVDLLPTLLGVNDVEKNPYVICHMRVEACAKLYKTDLFHKENIEYPEGLIFEDTATTPRLVARSKKTVSTHDILYYYLQREDSITSTVNEKIFHLYDIAQLLGEDKYASIYKLQFDFVRIRRIQILIEKLLTTGGQMVEVKKALNYLDKHLPNWENNTMLLEKKRHMRRNDRVKWFLLRHRMFFFIKLLKRISHTLHYIRN